MKSDGISHGPPSYAPGPASRQIDSTTTPRPGARALDRRENGFAKPLVPALQNPTLEVPMRRLGLVLVLGGGAVVSVAVAACSGGAPKPAVCSAPAASASSSAALASANTAFAAAFFAPAAASVGTGQNIIFSPYSVSATLTMVDAGAVGDTATQIQ